MDHFPDPLLYGDSALGRTIIKPRGEAASPLSRLSWPTPTRHHAYMELPPSPMRVRLQPALLPDLQYYRRTGPAEYPAEQTILQPS
jgi:hypothetical protein